MPDNSTTFSDKDAKRMLDRHIRVGPEKPISYLPINAINNVLGMEISTYTSLAKDFDAKILIFSPDDCCIKSGAVYAYDDDALRKILEDNKKVLIENGW